MAPRSILQPLWTCPRPLTVAPLALLSALGCTVFAPPTRITVLHTTSADRSLREEGTALNVDHWNLDVPPPAKEGTLERGFFVVKSDLEWHQRWPDTPTDKVPVLPADLNFAKEMLLVLAPPDKDVVATEARTVIVNEGGIHVYVNETLPGVDCPPPDRDAKPNYDLARVPLIDGKDVQFHVEGAPGDACGVAPQAKITCRAEGADPGYKDKLSVEPGTKVGCIVGNFTSPRPVIDLTWTFAGLPLGATTKMVVGNRGTSVSFTPDVFGTYALQVEVLDDLQRRGTSSTEVDATPKEPLVLQLIWTKFDPDDDPSTFPRLAIEALALNPDGSIVGGPKVVHKAVNPVWKKGTPFIDPPHAEPPLPGAPGAPPITFGKTLGCSIASTAAYCKARALGFTTVMTLDPSAASLYAVGVHFIDDRVQGQAVPCVRSYRAGKLVADLCDTNARKADAWWQVAVIDAATGKTTETLAAERAQAAMKAAADKAAADAKAAIDAKMAADKKALEAERAAAALKAAPAASAAPVGSARLGVSVPATAPVGSAAVPRPPTAPPPPSASPKP